MPRVSMFLLALVAWGLGAGLAAAQLPPPPDRSTEVLATVQIPREVLADGQTLPAGTYEIRLTSEIPRVLPGQSPEAVRWVEFVSGGEVVAREVAEVLRDDDLPEVGASSIPARAGTRVEMLRDGEFLRVSVKRGDERYLVYLHVPA